VVGLGFGVYTCASSATVVYTMYTLALWVSERVVCVRGAYCHACEVVKSSQSARALHVMQSAFINNETLSQLDVHSTENTQIISLPQAM